MHVQLYGKHAPVLISHRTLVVLQADLTDRLTCNFGVRLGGGTQMHEVVLSRLERERSD